MSTELTSYPEAGNRLDSYLRRQIAAKLNGLHSACIQVRDPQGTFMLGLPATGGLSATVAVSDMRFYRLLALKGSVGAGEAYMLGYWRTDQLVDLMRILLLNRGLLDGLESGSAKIAGLLLRCWHRLNRNTKSGSRENIHAHYDLGNELFKVFLDRRLMYSSALYPEVPPGGAALTLEQASEEKLQRICAKLALAPADHVIEIGSGWGGFAIYAAQRYGCRITTTTISREQFDETRRRVQQLGLQDRVTVLLQDYRELSGRYDKLVSIEMIEAVGHHYLNTYLARCASLLKPDGLMLIQSITIEDHRYRQALGAVDFIQRYIFPGSFVPCVSAIVQSAATISDLRLLNLEDIGPSYAQTMRAWRNRFETNLEHVRRLGYDDRFIRLWRFYLAYCEAGFTERSISDVQLLFARPANRRPQWAP